MKKNRRIQWTIDNAQLTIMAVLATMLITACTAETTEPGCHADEATVTINATTAAFKGAATRATADIKTKFLPGDEIEIKTGEGARSFYKYTTAATWEPTYNNDVMALPLSPTADFTLTAEYNTEPDPLEATASTADGTIALTIDPTTGRPQWNITLNFTHQKAVVDVMVMDPQMNIITTLMQSVTINNGTPSNTPTNILMPTTETITKVRVVVAGITYDADVNPAATLAANTRYTIAFICNPVKPTVTINTTAPNWTEGETATVPAGYHYYIYTKKDLEDWATDMATPANLDKKAIQMANIEWNDDWTPVGTDGTNPFTGTYNGNGHTITGLNIGTTGTYSGMFGNVSTNAILTGIHLRGATMSTTANYAGLLAGNANAATISLCSTQGTITNTGGTYVGGLVGSASTTHITRCYADATITHTAPTGSYTGGLVGTNHSPIVACGANTNITVTGSSNYYHAGGLVGGNGNTIYFCYATGTVSISGTGSKLYAGGLAGSNIIISNCYATATPTVKGVNTGEIVASGNPGSNCTPSTVRNKASIVNIRTIHRDPNTRYHDALNPITVTFNANDGVWTGDNNNPVINYNYEGGN